MPRRKGYDVAPNRREGRWVLKSGTTTERYEAKADARRAVSEAKSEGNSHVIIRKKDGGVVYFMRAA